MYNKNIRNPAFTLVELIVVIVILAILATIAFLSFSSQSSSARDSTRLSDLSNLAKGIGVLSAMSGKYPMPDKMIQIVNGSLGPIGYQGEAGDGVRRIIKASKDGMKDPLDKTNYTYAVNKGQSRYELMAFLENKGSMAYDFNALGGLGDMVGATDYVDRYAFATGDSMGIILSESGNTITPLQDMPQDGTVVSSTGSVDISTVSNTYSGVVAVMKNGSESVTVNASLAEEYNPPVITTNNAMGSFGNPGTSCLNLKNNGITTDGVHWIDTDGVGGEDPFQVYCDISGGGWTLIVNIKQGDTPAEWSTKATGYNFGGDRTKTYRMSDASINNIRNGGNSIYRTRTSTNNLFYYTKATNEFTTNIPTSPDSTGLCTDEDLTLNCQNLYVDANTGNYGVYTANGHWDFPGTFTIAGLETNGVCHNKPGIGGIVCLDWGNGTTAWGEGWIK